MAESTASPAAPVADAPVEVLSAVPSRLASEAVETPAGSGTQTPTVELTPEERVNSVNVSLADLAAKGQAKYGQKQYEEAAEIFSQAAEMQAELNGEMAPENAEILFHYGRALFKVGQSKSDVLGGKAPAAGGASGAEKAAGKKKGGENGVAKKAKKEEAAAAEAKDEQQKTAEEGGEKATGRASKADDALEAKKPLFQFTGDENFDDSEEEEEEVSGTAGRRAPGRPELTCCVLTGG